jgi:hypothetical protein
VRSFGFLQASNNKTAAKKTFYFAWKTTLKNAGCFIK